jgi:hypothetical protein
MRILLVSAAILSLLFGVVYAADAPFMKDGFWSMHTVNTMTSEGNQKPKTTEITMSRCNKGAALPVPGNPPETKDCKMLSQSSNGATKMFEMQCTINGHVAKVKQTTTTKGEDENHSVTESSFDPPMNGLSEMKLVADWKYLGPCPAGIEPNDVVMPDGKVIHQPEP